MEGRASQEEEMPQARLFVNHETAPFGVAGRGAVS